ncbi:MAG: hypothetical protein ACI9XR_000096 [Flavobacterium sp.]|jgi:hypothetical protein
MLSMLHSAGTIPKTISGGTFISSDFYSDNITFENNMRGVNGTFTPYANTKKNFRTTANRDFPDANDEEEKCRI